MIERIKQDLLTARRSKDKEMLTLLSTLVGEIENKTHTLGDKASISTIKAFVKSTKENLERTQDSKYQAELDVYLSYLPKEVTVAEVVESIKAGSYNSMPEVMKAMKEKYKDSFNGVIVKEAYKESLKT